MNNLAYSRYKNDLRETFQKAAEHLRFLRISHLAQEHVPEDGCKITEQYSKFMRYKQKVYEVDSWPTSPVANNCSPEVISHRIIGNSEERLLPWGTSGQK